VAKRASDRVEVEIPIEVAGLDCLGFQFLDRTRTMVVGRNGGRICLERKLVPQQEVNIRVIASGMEADAEIVGQVGQTAGAHHYGVKFLERSANIWGIEFPPLAEAEMAAGRVLLECQGCKYREVRYLDEFEFEVLEAAGHLSRLCSRCRDVCLWRKGQAETPSPITAVPPLTSPAPIPNRRREPRREMRVTACVRTARFGQDLVETRNVSRSGLCFVSHYQYVRGEKMEVAVPYSPGGGNIFFPAKIVRAQSPAEGMGIYGVAYQSFKP
jgi:hypothetical protein